MSERTLSSVHELRTIADLFFRVREISSGRQDLLLRDDSEREGGDSLSAPDLLSNVHGLALALDERGLQPGERVAIFSDERPEWAVADFAAQICGLATVPIDPRQSTERVAFILRNSRTRLVFYSGSGRRDVLRELENALTNSPSRIALDPPDGDEASLTRLLGEYSLKRSEIPLERFRGRPQEHDVSTLFYPPDSDEGVAATHAEMLGETLRAVEILEPKSEDLLFSDLPFAKDVRALHLAAFLSGARICYGSTGDAETFHQAVLRRRPTVIASETASAEALAESIRREAQERGGLTRKGFAAALEDSAMKAKLSRRLLLGPIREALGLDRLRRWILVGEEMRPEAAAALAAVGTQLRMLGGIDPEGLVGDEKQAML